MKVLLRLNGWEKIEELPEYIANSGKIEAILYPPMDIFIADRDKSAVNGTATSAVFLFAGKWVNGKIPIFDYSA